MLGPWGCPTQANRRSVGRTRSQVSDCTGRPGRTDGIIVATQRQKGEPNDEDRTPHTGFLLWQASPAYQSRPLPANRSFTCRARTRRRLVDPPIIGQFESIEGAVAWGVAERPSATPLKDHRDRPVTRSGNRGAPGGATRGVGFATITWLPSGQQGSSNIVQPGEPVFKTVAGRGPGGRFRSVGCGCNRNGIKRFAEIGGELAILPSRVP